MSKQTFSIEIIETLSSVVEVVADNNLEAVEKIKAHYKNEDIVLSSEHHISTEFHVKGCNDNANH